MRRGEELADWLVACIACFSKYFCCATAKLRASVVEPGALYRLSDSKDKGTFRLGIGEMVSVQLFARETKGGSTAVSAGENRTVSLLKEEKLETLF